MPREQILDKVEHNLDLTLADLLNLLIKNFGITRSRLAALSGIDNSVLSKIMNRQSEPKRFLDREKITDIVQGLEYDGFLQGGGSHEADLWRMALQCASAADRAVNHVTPKDEQFDTHFIKNFRRRQVEELRHLWMLSNGQMPRAAPAEPEPTQDKLELVGLENEFEPFWLGFVSSDGRELGDSTDVQADLFHWNREEERYQTIWGKLSDPIVIERKEQKTIVFIHTGLWPSKAVPNQRLSDCQLVSNRGTKHERSVHFHLRRERGVRTIAVIDINGLHAIDADLTHRSLRSALEFLDTQD